VIRLAKSKYEEWLQPDGLLRITAWARDGLIDREIAHNMGVSLSTLSDWKNKYPVIMESLKHGKQVVDIAVENALYKRTQGYEYTETTSEPLYDSMGTAIIDENGKPIIAVTKIVKKQVAPDVTAQIFWLKNRKPKEWRDKQDVEVTGKDGKDFEIKLIGV